MKLNKLIIEEFKGIKNFELDLSGESVNIYGDNAAGKTTIFDAFTWCLFHKDSEDKAVFDIKRRNDEGEIPFIDHSVTVIFDSISFTKVYREEWTKKRGNVKKEFSGHKSDYFINNVPVQKGEYDKKVLEVLGDEKTVKTLSNPLYFNNNLTWQERREALIALVGDVSMDEVIKQNPDFKDLPSVLNNNSIDDTKKVLNATKTKINKQLQEIPARIDELSRSIPAECEQSTESLYAKANSISKEKSEINQAIADLKNGDAQVAIKIEISEINAALADLETSNRQHIATETAKIYAELEQLKKEQSLYKFTRDMQESLAAQKASIEKDLDLMRVKYIELAAQKCSEGNTCPTCNQPYLKELLDKRQADFNLNKAKKLEEIDISGKTQKAKLKEIEQQIKENQEKLKMDQLVIKCYKDKQEQLLCKIEQIEQANKLEDNPIYQATLRRKQEAQNKLLTANSDSVIIEKQKELEATLLDLDEKEGIIQTLIAQKMQVTNTNKRIDELKAEEKRLADEYMKCCENMQLIEDYIIAKVSFLTDKINSKFTSVQFQLFDKQVDGGLIECCQAVVGGARYGKGLNRGAMINAGLEIISVLSNHSGVKVPIFIDNAEAVTKFIDVNAQVIKLIVSENDKKLRMQKAG